MKEYYLVYDDACEICQSGIEHLKRLDRDGLVTPVPLSAPNLPESIELPPASELARQVHLFSREGQLWTGTDAVAQITGLFPQTRLWSWVLRMPIIRELARPTYRLIAKNRRSIGHLMGKHPGRKTRER